MVIAAIAKPVSLRAIRPDPLAVQEHTTELGLLSGMPHHYQLDGFDRCPIAVKTSPEYKLFTIRLSDTWFPKNEHWVKERACLCGLGQWELC
jgi:hypothetical protein